MKPVSQEIQNQLFQLSDANYRDFHCRLIPTVDSQRVIGVRVPDQRKIAKQAAKEKNIEEYLSDLPHEYYEENNVHCFIIETMKDYETAIEKTEMFLPYIDNWATCDSFSPKVFAKHRDDLYRRILIWLKSDKTYTVRFAIGMLMAHFLEDAFDPSILQLVAAIKSQEYYINMMIAWFFATALSKQYTDTVPFLENHLLSDWVHNKTIQKSVESYRINDDIKEYLRTLRIKQNKHTAK